MTQPTAVVTELIGVYNADGSVRGELAYLVRKLAGRGSSALCDITHGLVRRRPAFDELAGTLGVPFTLLHRDERAAEVVAASAGREPCVLARTGDGLVLLLGPAELAACGHDLAAFAAALAAALRAAGLR